MYATYSPEDNKLRLYPDSRLSKEDYDKVRAHGFIWAPKQELFVAPSWSPAREDFLKSFTGQDIEDEDTSLVQRAEQRAERFDSYSEHRNQDAANAQKAVHAIADNIPFGQPILVGHHSEKRARRDQERIHDGMHKAVVCWERAEYWTARAQGAIRAAKYKERTDVRARRIKKLEAEKRAHERNRKEAQECLTMWNSVSSLQDALVVAGRSDAGYLPVVLRDNGANWHAWDVLQPDGRRYEACPSKSVEEVQEAARRHYPHMVAYNDRWIAHLSNRIAYEKAMLADAGGTVADKNRPQVGGACKCWVRHGWCEIVKVNRVTVTVMDNWGNGGKDFARNIPFDKLVAVLSPEEYAEIKVRAQEVA